MTLGDGVSGSFYKTGQLLKLPGFAVSIWCLLKCKNGPLTPSPGIIIVVRRIIHSLVQGLTGLSTYVKGKRRA